MANNILYVSTANRGVLAIDPDTLEIIGEFGCDTSLAAAGEYATHGKTVSTTPTVIGDKIIYAAADGSVYLRSVSDGKLISSVNVGSPLLSDPLLDGKLLTVVDLFGRVYRYVLPD